MIPVSAVTLDTSTKNAEISRKKPLRTPRELLLSVGLSEADLPEAIDSDSPFPTKVTPHFASLIEHGNPHDPLLRQVLPLANEALDMPGFTTDPLAEGEASVTPGLVHKYKNRALLIAHQACASHCRYCFRRHFPYSNQRLTDEAMQTALAYIKSHPDITEIILSGGDPLSLSDHRLDDMLNKLEALPQLQTIRLHTRTPVFSPERLTETLVTRLQNSAKNLVVVLHVNHPNELSPTLVERLQPLRQSSVTLLNQSVLLKGVNDQVDVLQQLSEQLFDAGILPYYLHLLDPVKGVHAFALSEEKAHQLWCELQNSVSGYLLPRLVKEWAGQPSKTWSNPQRT